MADVVETGEQTGGDDGSAQAKRPPSFIRRPAVCCGLCGTGKNADHAGDPTSRASTTVKGMLALLRRYCGQYVELVSPPGRPGGCHEAENAREHEEHDDVGPRHGDVAKR